MHKLAKEHGIASTTLDRASKALGVFKLRRESGWTWSLVVLRQPKLPTRPNIIDQ